MYIFMNKTLILFILLLLLLTLTQSSKKLRRGLHHHASGKKEGGGGYGYSFFDRNRQEDDSSHKRAKKEDDLKAKKVSKYYRSNNVYAAKRADEIAQKLGKNVANLLYALFQQKMIEPKVVPGRRVKASCGPRSSTGVLMEHWMLFTLISVVAVVAICGIDCLSNKRMASKYASTVDSQIQLRPRAHTQGSMGILAFIKNGGYQGLREMRKKNLGLEE